MEDKGRMVAVICNLIGRRTNGFVSAKVDYRKSGCDFALEFEREFYFYSVSRRQLLKRTSYAIALQLFCNAEQERVTALLPVIKRFIKRFEV